MSGVKPSERLAELGLSLPKVAAPVAAYVPAVRHRDLIFTSGQLPVVSGDLTVAGVVGSDVSVEDATEAAKTCALNALAAAAELAGGIDNIARIVKVVGYVASEPGFTGQPAVINGASNVIGEIFGEAGAHARAAVGVAALPLGAPVEVELTVSVAH
ncbi:Enamine deaminase RidA, house cleaning of reactive enamine intermediates, YjgF/YER057c/UK114 family [Bowdeniella nasicola]|uniref:Enamine deaminase RidA, house cleaning of reactive enamine intermediates, YjgF/YER057c/UK114 family n=1 Tax=Bowdeniella nasicola TaxID=208480 RepID=A0A1H3WV86_9ACTO|nr:RidA family protein [Bowdeniella nasicola]SDZ91066.1 Enamine deaminase RidA, house cleaning of reactive enamine intermediates, YjgF/YER057c/UK114 family [Bowdeniella nasicola]